ncbi:MAG TPA: hypothetical protein VFW11_24260 [Cyclobacteriaceae bacterium]|nr:hypothetical protein [Cyclobacteriaceae bacterium]
MKNKNSNSISLALMVGLLLLSGVAFGQQPKIQYFRPYDQRGINVFETSKEDTVSYDGLRFRIGASFAQQYQSLSHSNSANYVGEVNKNQLYDLSPGFNLAMANLNFDVQLTDGVRVSLVSYMSSRHHNEFWVKGGYFQIDKVGFLNSDFMNNLWKNLTLKIGHMEINYGDAHFRRSDGGNTIWNPFIENNIVDAFTTEIGGELYWQKSGVIAMVGITDGEIQGSVTKPDDRKPSFYGKLGYDKKFGERNRARLTGSVYTTKSSISNTIYGGDRTGSHYYFVLEPANATLTGNAFSGRINPGFKDNVTSFMINPFVKVGGLEFFGTYETAKGNAQIENGEIQSTDPANPVLNKLDERTFQQFAGDLVYRFSNDRFYVGAKYNLADGTLAFGQSTTQPNISQGTRGDVKIERTAFAAGWFITRNILFKGEYVVQKYKDFPANDIRSNGKFDGFVIEGIIGF